MSDYSPITPPPELFAQCYEEAERNLQASFPLKFAMSCAIRTAYAAGADQQLEASCADIHTVYGKKQADWLRSMRRPKPPSSPALAASRRSPSPPPRPPMTKPLSSSAQAVLDAYGDFEPANVDAMAAALLAAADQVVPLETAPKMMRGHELERLAQRQHTRNHLLAIAAELEAYR